MRTKVWILRNMFSKRRTQSIPLSYLCLRTVEHFLVGHRGDQAEAVTLGGLDVHDGRSGESQPFPPDTWGQGATGCWDGLQRRWGRWRWWRWRGGGKSGGSEERCLPQDDRGEGSNRCSFNRKQVSFFQHTWSGSSLLLSSRCQRCTLHCVQVTSINTKPKFQGYLVWTSCRNRRNPAFNI